MARRNLAEILVGAGVIVLAAGFLGYAVARSGRPETGGYPVHAKFQRIDGLDVGAPVRLAGIRVGTVSTTALDPQTYEAEVTLIIADKVKLPKDTSAAVASEGLLGGKYINLVPGADEQMIASGGEITITQPAINVEDLLGRFIFSAANLAAQSGQGKGRPAPASGGGGADATGGAKN